MVSLKKTAIFLTLAISSTLLLATPEISFNKIINNKAFDVTKAKHTFFSLYGWFRFRK